MKIFLTIIFNISILYANEALLIPSNTEINKSLSPLKGGCDQCADAKTSSFNMHYFDKFNCKNSGNTEDSFKKAALAAGLTEEKYGKMKIPEQDRTPSKEEIEELKSLLRLEKGIFTKCMPKAMQAVRENINEFKLCNCDKISTGYV
ncbi:MAG: hypothetical protein Q7U04_12545, partial [Bacteriovorax sp.]|nr:hypothetical protein [Bacteriovorax sp.]